MLALNKQIRNMRCRDHPARAPPGPLPPLDMLRDPGGFLRRGATFNGEIAASEAEYEQSSTAWRCAGSGARGKRRCGRLSNAEFASHTACSTASTPVAIDVAMSTRRIVSPTFIVTKICNGTLWLVLLSFPRVQHDIRSRLPDNRSVRRAVNHRPCFVLCAVVNRHLMF